MNVQSFLADGFHFELGRLRHDLNAIPDEQFHAPKLGHSPAWHALHVAEWLRFFPMQDFSATYAHLGWEDAEWLPALLGTPPVAERATKAEILVELDRVTALIVPHVQHLTDAQLDDTLLAPAALGGKRQRLIALRIALTHVSYHRAHLNLSLKDDQV